MGEKATQEVISTTKRKRKRTISLFIIIFLFMYIPSLFHWIFGRKIPLSMMETGTIEDSINTWGYVVRDEQVLVSPISGMCILKADEGEKIPSGYNVLTVLSDDTLYQMERLKEVELKIVQAQKEKSQNIEFFSNDLVKLENEIGEKVKLLAKKSQSNSLDDVSSFKQDIDALIQKKVKIMSAGGTDEYIESLNRQRKELQDRINSSSREVTSDISGIISYTIDEYESLLRPNAIQELTPTFLESVVNKQVKQSENSMVIEKGQPFAKVIKDFEYYIVACIEPEDAEFFTVNKRINLRINDINKVINGYVTYKSVEIEGKYIIAIKVDKALSETSSLRKLNIDLIKSSYTGLKVPVKSLMEIDALGQNAKIVTVDAFSAKIVDVKIVGRNDEYAIIDNPEGVTNNVSLYKTYVLKPDNVQEGQIVR